MTVIYEMWRGAWPAALYWSLPTGVFEMGIVLQVLQTTYATNTNLTTTIPFDDTTPLSTEGTQVLSQAITLARSTNRVVCLVQLWGAGDATTAQFATAALFRGTTCINVAATVCPQNLSGSFVDTASDTVNVSFSLNPEFAFGLEFLDSPGTTTPTYSVRVGPDAGTIRLNGTTAARRFGGTSACTLTLMELAT